MAIAFAYAPATNTVVVTGGTAGTPATFADFVIADRLGSYVIMDAIATAMNLTLDRLIRPTEFRALKITFMLAGTNAGAGDTVDITGTDAWGNAQTESINVAAGNGAYASAKYWRTITDIDCTGFADGVGTINAYQTQWGVIWDYGNGQYQIDAYFYVGDESTSTYFASEREFALFNVVYFKITDSAELRLGTLTDESVGDGAYWKVLNSSGWKSYGGTFKAYCSTIMMENISTAIIFDSTLIFKKVIFFGPTNNLMLTNSNNTFEDVFFSQPHRIILTAIPTIFNDVAIDRATTIYGTLTAEVGAGTFITEGVEIVNSAVYDYCVGSGTEHSNGIIRNPVIALTQAKVRIRNDGCFLREEYSCNVHIADKDGTDLGTVNVKCEDKDDNEVFSVNTNAGGDIAKQWIPLHLWEDTVKTETIYSPHKFTISKAGYETLVLDKITVDEPIVWHLELLDELPASDVRDGVAYGEDGIGNLEIPAVGDVEDGVGFGSNGVEFTGDFVVPAEEDVEVGVDYGAGGVEFEGTYLGLRGNNLTAYLQKSVALVGYLEKKVTLTGELKP